MRGVSQEFKNVVTRPKGVEKIIFTMIALGRGRRGRETMKFQLRVCTSTKGRDLWDFEFIELGSLAFGIERGFTRTKKMS